MPAGNSPREDRAPNLLDETGDFPKPTRRAAPAVMFNDMITGADG